MIIHNDSRFAIYFGDVRDQFVPAQFYNLEHVNKLFEHEPFTQVKKHLKLHDIVFLKQVHDKDGFIITNKEQLADLKPFSHEGDFLVTSLQSVGLGIATADCLPIILYDSFSNCIALVHAGWRGSLKKIAQRALECMINQCGARLESIKVFFGPSAKSCCYQVGSELLAELEQFSHTDQVLLKHDDGWYFDMPQFNRILLQESGLKKNAFYMHYNMCTICDDSFCSYRRSKGAPERQMTVIALK